MSRPYRAYIIHEMKACNYSSKALRICQNKSSYIIYMCPQNICGKGSFKCYVTLEGVGGYMPKRYEALRGVGGGVTSALRNVFFFS